MRTLAGHVSVSFRNWLTFRIYRKQWDINVVQQAHSASCCLLFSWEVCVGHGRMVRILEAKLHPSETADFTYFMIISPVSFIYFCVNKTPVTIASAALASRGGASLRNPKPPQCKEVKGFNVWINFPARWGWKGEVDEAGRLLVYFCSQYCIARLEGLQVLKSLVGWERLGGTSVIAPLVLLVPARTLRRRCVRSSSAPQKSRRSFWRLHAVRSRACDARPGWDIRPHNPHLINNQPHKGPFKEVIGSNSPSWDACFNQKGLGGSLPWLRRSRAAAGVQARGQVEEVSFEDGVPPPLLSRPLNFPSCFKVENTTQDLCRLRKGFFS